jgi:hypothetical protein
MDESRNLIYDNLPLLLGCVRLGERSDEARETSMQYLPGLLSAWKTCLWLACAAQWVLRDWSSSTAVCITRLASLLADLLPAGSCVSCMKEMLPDGLCFGSLLDLNVALSSVCAVLSDDVVSSLRVMLHFDPCLSGALTSEMLDQLSSDIPSLTSVTSSDTADCGYDAEILADAMAARAELVGESCRALGSFATELLLAASIRPAAPCLIAEVVVDDIAVGDATQLSRGYPTLSPMKGGSGCVLMISGTQQMSQFPVCALNALTGEMHPLRFETPIPQPFAQHTCTTFDGVRFYLMGNDDADQWDVLVVNLGNYYRFGCQRRCTVSRVEPTFVNCTELPPNLHCHTAVPYELPNRGGGVILVFGGASYHRTLNDLFEFRVNQRHWVRILPVPGDPVPPKRLYHMACMCGSRMYVLGGTTTEQDPVYGDLWYFDYPTKRWTEVTPLGDVPCPRGSASLHLVEPYMYLIGGFDGKESLRDAYRLDPATHVWRRLSSDTSHPHSLLGRPCWGSGSCVAQDRTIVISGGFRPATESLRPIQLADAAIRIHVPQETLASMARRWLERANLVVVRS